MTSRKIYRGNFEDRGVWNGIATDGTEANPYLESVAVLAAVIIVAMVVFRPL